MPNSRPSDRRCSTRRCLSDPTGVAVALTEADAQRSAVLTGRAQPERVGTTNELVLRRKLIVDAPKKSAQRCDLAAHFNDAHPSGDVDTQARWDERFNPRVLV